MPQLKGVRRQHPLYWVAAFLFSCSVFTSCVSSRNISYFNQITDSLKAQPVTVQLQQFTDPKIQPNDLLQISVQTIDPQGTAMMGTQQGTSYGTTGAAGAQGGGTVPGYLVDQNGEIELPLVGKIKVGGMTTMEARAAIAKRASEYYKNPVVNIRFANFVITVLGEVNSPGQYTVPNEKISILEAIGMAGDLTVYGKRGDIILIREDGGEKKFVRLDINSRELFQSPYYYLRQHDVLYVNPTRNKAAAADVTTARTLSFVSTGVTILTLIITVATRF